MRVPSAELELLLEAGGFSSPEAVQRVRRQVEAWGADPARIVLEGPTGQREHLGAFVARTLEEHVDVARRHAQELHGLAAIRLGLRLFMLESPLLGGASYCRAVEAAYREIWRAWFRTQAGTTS